MIELTNGKGFNRMYTNRDDAIRHRLPYGKWTCEDGREVLFDRDYVPTWQKIDGVVSRPDSKEWVKWKNQEWFYRDATPYKEREKISKWVLEEFGGSLDDILWEPRSEVKQWNDTRSRKCFTCHQRIYEKDITVFLGCLHSFCSPVCAEGHKRICERSVPKHVPKIIKRFAKRA